MTYPHKDGKSLLLVDAIAFFGPTVKAQLKWHLVEKRRGHARLQSLTPAEKHFLANYLLNYSRAHYGKIQDGVVRELEANHIVRRAASLSAHFTSFAYNIQPWAWDYLIEHPECVDLTPEQVTEARSAAESGA